MIAKVRRLGTAVLAGSSLWVLGVAVAHGQAQPPVADASKVQSQVAATAPVPVSSADPNATTAVQEVIVTGEKRQTTIQKAPLAITAVNSETLEKDNLNRLADLNGHVPSLTVGESGPFVTAISIRGVGFDTGDNISSQPGVSYHLDGVYISSPYALTANFVDPQRVEVLRGPQGTVFGQSSEGGAINLITVQPKLDDFSGRVEASYGSYNLAKTEGAVNLPIGSTLAVRIVGQSFRHDGFASETGLVGYHDYALDDADDYAGKVSLLWRPTAEFSATVTAQSYSDVSHGAALKSLDDPNPDPRKITQDYPNRYALHFTLYSADLDYTLPFATLKSLTAYQQMRNGNQVDNDRLTYATAAPFLDPLAPGFYDDVPKWDQLNHTFTQEFDLTSRNTRWFDWLVGAFYLRERISTAFFEFEGTDPDPTITIPTSQATLPYNFNYDVTSALFHDSLAGFGQGTLHIRPWLRLTAGGRYTHEKLSSDTLTDFGLYAPLVHLVSKDHELTGKAELEADVTPRNLVYFSWSKGYKPGGVNLNNAPLLAPLVFQPETVNAYEVGSKNRFLANRLTLNAAGFYYNYKNFQYEEEDPIPYQGGVANVPSAYIWGLEAEGTLAITPHLRLDANVTHLDGRFTGDYFALDPSIAHHSTLAAQQLGYGPFDPYTIAARAGDIRNTNGNKPSKLPDYEGSIDAEHTLPIGSGLLTSRLEFVYRGTYIYRIFNDGARDHVPAYGIWNLNFDYKPAGHWDALLTFSNLFDKAGVNSRYSNPFGSFTTDQQYIPPRQVFGTVRYEF